jgi:hypothetical protein
MTWGIKRAEYCADFVLIARRHLSAKEFALFRMHFLEGRDFRYCCPRLGLDRGNFFHAVYRIEERLGRVFREITPYGLFPVDEYLYARDARHPWAPNVPPVSRCNLYPPLQKTNTQEETAACRSLHQVVLGAAPGGLPAPEFSCAATTAMRAGASAN